MAAGPRVWITRAQPGAGRTADRLALLGLTPVVAPLLAIQPIAQAEPDLTDVAVLAFTSINGVAAFADLAPERDRPVFAVGDATAQAARDAGFVDVRSASGDLHALARLIASELSDGVVLVPQAESPAGDFDAALSSAGARKVSIQPLIVYRARPTTVAAPMTFDAVLLHSPRAAKILTEQDIARLSHAVTACISPAAAAPLVALGLTPAVAETPDEASLLTILKAALGKRDAAV